MVIKRQASPLAVLHHIAGLSIGKRDVVDGLGLDIKVGDQAAMTESDAVVPCA